MVIGTTNARPVWLAQVQPENIERVPGVMATEAQILAEAEGGPLKCRLYKGYGERDAEGFARDGLCSALADAGRLKLSGVEGSRTSPFGMVRTWVKA